MKVVQKPRDPFAHDNMPPTHLRPKFINLDVVPQSAPFNCAEELLDKAIDEGHAKKIAIYSSDTQWTYGQLLEKTNQIAHVLREDFGLVAGNRVLLRSANKPMLLACWLAVIKAGGIVVTTIAMLRAKEIANIAQQSNAEFALCDLQLKDELEAAAEQIDQLSKILYFNDAEGLEARMKKKPGTFENHPAKHSDIAIIAFTSGTTGQPKAALHSHHAIIAVCETFSKQVIKPTSEDIFSGTPPLGFVYGLGGLLLFPLHARAATVMLEDVRTAALAEAISRFKISVLFTAPTAYKALLDVFDATQLRSLRKGISAGEALPNYVSKGWLDKAGIRLIDGIGSTEMLHIFISVQHRDDPIGSLGKAVPGYEACIVDKEGNPVPVNEIGYLAVRGPSGCLYLNDTRQAKYVINGWNVTGDSAKIDAAGYFWYQARTDGMIISSGYNIAGPEVEQTISQHPAIAECAVIGAPDPERGNIVKAYVVLKDGIAPSSSLVKDIQDFAKQKGAPYKYPRSVEFIDALPRTPTGKVQHFALRERAGVTKSPTQSL